MALLVLCCLAEEPFIVAGDLNSSETFDYLWHGDPSGNREIMDRMNALGFYDCFHTAHTANTRCVPHNLTCPRRMPWVACSSGIQAGTYPRED